MIKFGPSGNSLSFYAEGHKHTEESAKYIKDRGLDVFEYSFGRGVRMTESTGKSIGKAFADLGLELTVHAPYFINFANPNEEKASNSYRYVLDSLQAMTYMGGKRCVFHPATQGDMDRRDAVELARHRMSILADKVHEAGYDKTNCILCPETMGKIGQIGDVDEVVYLCQADDIYIPTIDFGHLNARTHGGLKTKDDYKREIDKIYEGLGEYRAKNIHIHFSKIEYSKGGEVRHLTFADNVYGPEFEPLCEVIVEYGMTPCIICESDGTQAEDAMSMKETYIMLSK